MSCYFKDLVGSIAFLAYCNFLLSTQKKEIVHLHHIVLLMLPCGLVWEYVAPFFRSDTVTDVLDLVAYIFGGIIYWIIIHSLMSANPE